MVVNLESDLSEFKVDTSGDVLPKERLKKEELETQILTACKDEFISIDEIAKLISKDVKYLKNKIIPIMFKSGKLERLYPTINHPNQAYKEVVK